MPLNCCVLQLTYRYLLATSQLYCAWYSSRAWCDPRSQKEKSKALNKRDRPPSMHISTSLLLTISLSTANFNLIFKSYIGTTYLFEKEITHRTNCSLSNIFGVKENQLQMQPNSSNPHRRLSNSTIAFSLQKHFNWSMFTFIHLILSKKCHLFSITATQGGYYNPSFIPNG